MDPGGVAMIAPVVDVSAAERFTSDLLRFLSPTKSPNAHIEGRDGVVAAVRRLTGVEVSPDQVRAAAAAAGVRVSPVGGSVAVNANELRYAAVMVGSRAASVSGDMSWVRRPPRWHELSAAARMYGVEVPSL